jgi:predicted Fe-Mo cluster-binding NifX family protein/predicted DNA-binding protein (UPF0251 family)
MYGPLDVSLMNNEIIVMTIDEYETIRLIDLEGMMQEECADKMNVARTTVQRIYNDARRKLAASLVNGNILKMEGGEYKLCEENEPVKRCPDCIKNRCFSGINPDKEKNELKGETMKVAIPVEGKEMNSALCPSFGRTPFFLIYDLEKGEAEYIVNTAAESQGGAGIKAAQLIVDKGIEQLLTYRCGENSASVLQQAGIKIYKALNGTIQENLEALKEEKLALLTEFHAGFHGRKG